MKKGFTALAASAVVCSMAFASPSVNEPSFSGLNATEHTTLFGESSTAQAVALDGAEMKATEGEVINWIGGGILGGLSYSYGYYNGNYAWNNARFTGNIATGALIGGTFGAAGAIASGGAKLIPSLTNIGANLWRANSFGMNYGVNRGWQRR
jgi:hypothetical protein